MDEIELQNCTIRQKDCIKVVWRKSPIGLIFCDAHDKWRITTDLKAEFWTLDEFDNQETALESLVKKTQELNDYRIGLLQKDSGK